MTSRLTKKVAICVGQNEYRNPSISSLRGCVNDALLIGEMLKAAGFQVRQVHNEAATQRGILDRLSTEIAKLRDGDRFVFWNSSHGYQVNDREGDELLDHRDEAICSYDTDPRDPLTDDKLGRIVYRANPGAHVFFGSDSCFSGTLTRAGLQEAKKGDRKPRLWIPPNDVRFRSGESLVDLDAFAAGGNSVVDDVPDRRLGSDPASLRRFGTLSRPAEEKDMNHVLLSGCRSNQTSADASFPEGFYGAMTYNFAKAVLAAWKSGKSITYLEAHERALKGLEEDGFDQVPQLEGPDRLKDEPVFGHNPEEGK